MPEVMTSGHQATPRVHGLAEEQCSNYDWAATMTLKAMAMRELAAPTVMMAAEASVV